MQDQMSNPICGPPVSVVSMVSHRSRPTARHYSHLILVALLASTPAAAAWVEFADETATRLVAAPAVGVDDVEEKAFAWGDVDKDGDIDLVVARKEPFTSTGKRTNVLFLNQGGVLVDRTAEFAVQSDMIHDLGFLTPTNDRDILLVDLDLDGWLDVVTAPTQSDSDPKQIGHPRIFINLGEDQNGWLGFRHEDGRIPAMLSFSGVAGFNPRFAHVAAGDVNDDGFPDLYFSDYDVGGLQQPGSDFNDKLLLNRGVTNPGFFVDATASVFSGLVPLPGLPYEFPVSGFGAAAAIADMNGDDVNDIVKQTSLTAPLYVGIAYNDPVAPGDFDTFDVVNQNSPYYISIGDLNNDGRLDIVVTDDGQDRYMINQGNGTDTLADFVSLAFSYSHQGLGGSSGDQGFGGDNRIADLDNDGWNDVIVTDAHVDIPSCSRRLNVFRNLGGGGNVTLEEQTEGLLCQPWQGNPPSCEVVGLPASELVGTHDAAIFDLDGDGWKDLILGRCDGLVVLVNQPPTAAGGVPDGNGNGAGAPLRLGRRPDGQVELSWSASCSLTDGDYAIYQGTLGDFTSHEPRVCSTLGLTSSALAVSGDAYLLVVPSNGDNEGSYGYDSLGGARPPGQEACMPQIAAACDD